MITFIYHDNKDKGKVLLQVEAESILLADKVFWEQLGYDPARNPHVGCEVKSVYWKPLNKE